MTTNEKPRVAIWCAVSTDPQAHDDKVSLPDQLRQGTEWAERLGGEVVRVYEVVHTRSDYLFEEAKAAIPQYQALQDDLAGDAITHLWCRGWDRVARSEAVGASVARLLRRADAQIYSAKTGALIDADSLAGRVISSFERILAEEEIKELTRRHHFGIRGRVRRGLVVARWPHGYTAVRNAVGKTIGAEFNEAIGAVKLATDHFLRGLGYERIAAALNETPYRAEHGYAWGWRTVYNWMHNDVYGGIVSCGETVATERSDKFPALWDEDTHRAVQRERTRRRKGGRAPVSALSTLVSCARCGGSMTHARSGERQYFRCNNHARKQHDPDLACHPNYTREELIIDAVDAHIVKLQARSPEALHAVLFGGDDERAVLEQERAEFERRLRNVQERRARLADAVGDGAISFDTARAGEAKIERDEEAVAWELARLDEQLTLLPDDSEKRARIAMLAALPASIRVLQMDEARVLLRDCGVRVWCEDRRVVRVEPEIG